MKILLINPALQPERERTVYPVGLCYIATAISRSRHQLEILDLELERLTYEEFESRIGRIDFDIVGIGSIVTGYSIVKRLLSIVRKVNPEAIIVAGNSVATSIPEILLDKTEADITVIGEGDETIVKLLDCIDEKSNLNNVAGIWFK